MQTTRKFLLFFNLIVLFFTSGQAVWALQSDEKLDDPVLEERASNISKGLRCVVCKNQSIDESNASLARDLRILVRDRVKEGYTDEEVVDSIVDSYGEFILLRPKFSMKNMFLWVSPMLALIGGFFLAITFLRDQKNPQQPVSPLSDEEQKDLARLVTEQEASEPGPNSDQPSPPERA